MARPLGVWLLLACLAPAPSFSRAGEPVTLENVVPSGKNLADEPIAKAFSAELAGTFLDTASLHWQKSRQCFTCHTNYAYLVARPYLGADTTAHRQVRAFAEELVAKRWEEKGPRWDAEVVATAAALAMNDAATTGKLHPLTKTALDRIWTVQRADGGFDWLKCGWPPMENDDEYGAVLAALAVGIAPENYRSEPQAQEGIARLRKYLETTKWPTLHHRAMLVWAAAAWPEILSADARQKTLDDLSGKQLPDGGWSASSLGDWTRADDTPQTPEVADGYGTGFALFVLMKGGVPAADPRIEKGIAWLKTHQRESGRWYTRSLYKDGHHFLTHAGSAFAVMALGEAGALRSPPKSAVSQAR